MRLARAIYEYEEIVSPSRSKYRVVVGGAVGEELANYLGSALHDNLGKLFAIALHGLHDRHPLHRTIR